MTDEQIAEDWSCSTNNGQLTTDNGQVSDTRNPVFETLESRAGSLRLCDVIDKRLIGDEFSEPLQTEFQRDI
jgi:hypothetical protein